MTTGTALVTGASGHVGLALAKRLQAAGMRVRGLARTSAQAESPAERGPRHAFEHTLRALVDQAAAGSPALTR